MPLLQDARTSTNVEVKGNIRGFWPDRPWRQVAMDSYDWHEAGLTVGEVARRSGAAPSALRFYERQGLISTDRTAGNQRRYRGDVLCRVAMIRVCQQAGLTLAQIRAALAEAVPDGQIPGPQNWELLAQHLRRELGTRIHDLSRLLGALG